MFFFCEESSEGYDVSVDLLLLHRRTIAVGSHDGGLDDGLSRGQEIGIGGRKDGCELSSFTQARSRVKAGVTSEIGVGV